MHCMLYDVITCFTFLLLLNFIQSVLKLVSTSILTFTVLYVFVSFVLLGYVAVAGCMMFYFPFLNTFCVICNSCTVCLVV